jgi:hypothetical protein
LHPWRKCRPREHKKRKGFAGGKAGGSGGREKDAVALLLEVADVLSKESQKNSSAIQTLKAAVLHNGIVETESKLADTMFKAQVQYADKTRGKKGHKEGLPEHWFTVAVMHVLHEALVDPGHKSILKQLIDQYSSEGAKVFKKKVLACRAIKCRDTAKTRIEFKFSVVWADFEGLLVHYIDLNGEMLDGRAPLGPGEREIPALREAIKKLTAA